ncbi:Irgc [Symbiodinium sp. CCMP2456]|nr:Irgc [Symbiodinium sp. CCMP2456]
MSAIDKSGGADPRLLGRESWPQQNSGQKELEASKTSGSEAVDEVLQRAPGRFRGLVGGAWQRVQGIFRRSSSGTADEEDLQVGGNDASADGAEMLESQAASFDGDFRMLPPSAWEALHARFRPTKLEQEADAAATSPVSIETAATDMPVETTSQASESQDPALTEAPPSPESDWWLALCIAVQQSMIFSSSGDTCSTLSSGLRWGVVSGIGQADVIFDRCKVSVFERWLVKRKKSWAPSLDAEFLAESASNDAELPSPGSAEAPEASRAAAGAGGTAVPEMQELREQLEKKDRAILQLQADNHREQQTRDKQSAEKQMMLSEELREMTQRAEHLSEQVRKSKKRGTELQEAKDSVRSELRECQAQLRKEISVRSEIQTEAMEAEMFFSLSETKQEADATDAISLGDDASGAGTKKLPGDEAPSAGAKKLSGYQGKLAQCLAVLRRLQGELSSELRARAPGRSSDDSEAMTRIFQQIDKAQHLIDGVLPSAGSSPLAGAGPPSSSTKQPASPEAERPLPEDLKNLVRGVSTPSSLVGSPPSKDSEEALLMKLDINEIRVAAELEKQKLITEHCDELDDLVRRHDKERRELHRELAELRSDHARVEASETLLQPLQEIREHFESQVVEVKQELVTQLADIQERNRMQSGEVQLEMRQLRDELKRCQDELSSSQAEFRTLSMLYDKEQRENYRLRQESQQQSEMASGRHEAIGLEPVASDVANQHPTLTSADYSMDTTVATDILPVSVASPERAHEAATASNSNSVTMVVEESQAAAGAQLQVAGIPAPLPAPSAAVKQVGMKIKSTVQDEGREAPAAPPLVPTPTQARPSIPAVSVLRTALPIAAVQSRTLPAAAFHQAHDRLGTMAAAPQTPTVCSVVTTGPTSHRRVGTTTTTTTTTRPFIPHHRSASTSS